MAFNMRKCMLIFSLLLLLRDIAQSQETSQDSIKVAELNEVIFSFNKWEQQLNEVPNKITKISRAQILFRQPQTSADMLGQTGTVFIQKSQMGGGSPMIRGFATNRVLLVVDGVRMNNAIYRSGNLQNVISIDPLAIEESEVVFGPGSLIYGSDAIGGVMDFHSLEPRFSGDTTTLVQAGALARYSSANREKTIHADLNIGGRRISWVSSITYSSFDDLKMGKHGGQDNYLRPEYIQRIGMNDSIIKNADPRVQKYTGYEQVNVLQKIKIRLSEKLMMQYGFTYAGTGSAPRYDRLIQYRGGNLRFAEWNYGPMLWRMHNLNFLHTRKTAFYDNARLTIAYQNYSESRIDRQRNRVSRNIQTERVKAASLNWDAEKTLGKGQLFWGAEYVHNKVGSAGEVIDISNGNKEEAISRYPDGSKWFSSGLYGSYKININNAFTASSGIRYSYTGLDADFDNRYIPFPYDNARIRKGAFTFNTGMVYRAGNHWQFNANIASGYRMPNIDDIGKLFESAPGNITVPNPTLKPEYAWNFETGVAYRSAGLRVELTGFHTLLEDAIVRRPYSFNGQDSILFDGTKSRVEALQNVARATVWGLQLSTLIPIYEGFSARLNANYITGKETDETTGDGEGRQVPLRHAPPFYGNLALAYLKGKIQLELNTIYNSRITNSKLAPTEKTKAGIYAVDREGRPFSPDWYTVNLNASYRLNSAFSIQAAWENITNQRYRPYSSGLVAAGSQVVVGVRYGNR